ncbi:MAG: HNH endonuclease signature motif containing protein [Alphaproteobacteria bacterium]|nr:HNH endonuclease signature motif containing protein [Alphaproteobacteria bacterium]
MVRSGGDRCTRVKRAGVLGCKVDGGGFGRGDLHPDAEVVHDAVMRLVRDDRGPGLLVLQFGFVDLRPDWREGARPRWEPCQTRQRPDGGSDDPSNLQGMCRPCHSRKTATEDGGWGN